MFLFVKITTPLIIFILMFTVGVSTRLSDFKALKEFPRAFFVGSFLQMVSLPLLAMGIGYIGKVYFNLSPEMIFGTVLLGACPGGSTSNLFTLLGKGSIALSIVLTAVTALLAFITLPIIITLAGELFWAPQISSWGGFFKIVGGLFVFSTFPLTIGILFRHFRPQAAKVFVKKMGQYVIGLLVLIMLGAVLTNRDIIFDHTTEVLPVALLFNLTVMAVAYWTSRLSNLRFADRVAIVFECGFQNSGTAIMIALTFLNIPEIAIPAAFYTMIMYISAFGYLYYLRKRSRQF